MKSVSIIVIAHQMICNSFYKTESLFSIVWQRLKPTITWLV